MGARAGKYWFGHGPETPLNRVMVLVILTKPDTFVHQHFHVVLCLYPLVSITCLPQIPHTPAPTDSLASYPISCMITRRTDARH